MIAFLKAVIPALKQTWKDTRPKPKEVCAFCKGTGKILVPVMRVGSMTEYDNIKCHCEKKKK